MLAYKRRRLLKLFPCIAYLGLETKGLKDAEIRVSKVDDALKPRRATSEESGDGVHTDIRQKDVRFCFFASVDPKVTHEEIEGMAELRAESPAPDIEFESDSTVSDMLQAHPQSVVVIEVRTERSEFGKGEATDVIIHQV